MNKRTVSIIHELCQLKKSVHISDLAAQFSVSERTIRNDLNTINDALNSHGIPPLQLEKGGYIIRDGHFPDILSHLSKKDFYDYKLSKEERKKVAAAMLAGSSGYITLSAIADYLAVSRATVILDLEDIKTFMKSGNLEVLSHPNKGLRVEGKESCKRVFLMNLGAGAPEQTEPDIVTKQLYVDDETRNILSKILSEQEHVHESYLNDDSFQKILLYLGIMVTRNKQGEYMEVQQEIPKSKYSMAQDILRYICQYCHIAATDNEARFLGSLLSMAGYMKQNSSGQMAVKSQVAARQLIESVSEDLGINLNQDYDFFENLSNHLDSLFHEAPMEGPGNPVIQDVVMANKEVAAAVKKELPLLCRYAGREITDAEAGYIAVHVCAAIERRKNKEISFHVIVVCHAGIGTSRLLLERLKKHFNFQIVDIISSHEAQNLKPGQADFLLSTVPLKNCPIDFILVSPLLSDEDYIRIGNKVDSLRSLRNLPSRSQRKEKNARGLLNQIIPILYDTVPEDAGRLSKILGAVISDYFDQPFRPEDESFSPSLCHLLPETHIRLDVPCADWKQAIIQSALPLLQLGYIEKRYIDAMIRNVEENGPYIVISKGFAVPHEGIGQGSLKTGMSLIRLKDPVEFGHEDHDPVEFVCCLSAADHNTHLKAFFNLVNMVRDEQFLKELRNCRTAKEAAAILASYERLTEEV